MYLISNIKTGVTQGFYNGSTEEEAIDHHAQDTGAEGGWEATWWVEAVEELAQQKGCATKYGFDDQLGEQVFAHDPDHPHPVAFWLDHNDATGEEALYGQALPDGTTSECVDCDDVSSFL